MHELDFARFVKCLLFFGDEKYPERRSGGRWPRASEVIKVPLTLKD
jgi:hypothetical protein